MHSGIGVFRNDKCDAVHLNQAQCDNDKITANQKTMFSDRIIKKLFKLFKLLTEFTSLSKTFKGLGSERFFYIFERSK